MEELTAQPNMHPVETPDLSLNEVLQIKAILEQLHSGVTLVNNWNGDLITGQDDEIAFPAEVNRNFYNLFIIEGKKLKSRHFQMTAELCLNENYGTEKPIAKWLTHLGNRDIRAEIMKFPTIVATKNHDVRGEIDPIQKCHYGFITDIDIQRGFIGFDFKFSDSIDQSLVGSLERELRLKNNPRASELSVIHWSVKRADLIKTLRSNNQNLSYPRA